MPDVTVDPNKYDKYDLKSAPPDGFVMLRPLPYGHKLTRRDKATKMQMRATQDGRGRPSNKDEGIIELETLNEWATAFDFSYCIGEHNLTSNGEPLQFNDPKQVTMILKTLNPKVGSEIEKYINELNEDEDESDSEDFTGLATSSLEGHNTSLTDLNESETLTAPLVSPTT